MALIVAHLNLLSIQDLLHHVSLGVDGVIQTIVQPLIVIAAGAVGHYLRLNDLVRLVYVMLEILLILVLIDNLQVMCGCIRPDLH